MNEIQEKLMQQISLDLPWIEPLTEGDKDITATVSKWTHSGGMITHAADIDNDLYISIHPNGNIFYGNFWDGYKLISVKEAKKIAKEFLLKNFK